MLVRVALALAILLVPIASAAPVPETHRCDSFVLGYHCLTTQHPSGDLAHSGLALCPYAGCVINGIEVNDDNGVRIFLRQYVLLVPMTHGVWVQENGEVGACGELLPLGPYCPYE